MTRLLAAASLLVLAACGGSDGPTQPQVASVQVTPTTATLEAPGATVQLAASAKDAAGATVSAGAATWSSTDPGVATVSAAGLVTGVAAGTAAVTATIQGVVGTSVITVKQPPQTCDNPPTVTLGVGESTHFDAAQCFVLPAGAAGDRYRVSITRPDTTGGAASVVDATLSMQALGVTQAPVGSALPGPGPDLGPGLDWRAFDEAARVADATSAFHAELRRSEEQLVQEAIAAGIRPASTKDRPLRAAGAPSPNRIVIDTSTPNSCSAPAGAKAPAFLVYENDDMAIYQDSVQRASSPIGVGNAQRLATYYTAYAKQMIREYFGAPSDIDGNGKIVVFASPVVTGNTAAFVWSGDFFPTASCAASNEMELIFFSANLISQLGDEVGQGSQPNWQALETVAHEVKHVVSLHRRIQASLASGGSRFHPQWIEEGAAEIAGEMSSRIAWNATGGPAVNARITRSSFGSGGVNLTRENYGVLLRLARTISYLTSQPNGLVVSPNGAGQGHSIYGTGWHFHRWLGDSYGQAGAAARADSSFFRAQTDSLAGPGTTGLQQLTGKSFRQLFRDYVVALSLHGNGTTVGPFPFATYDFITATKILANQPEGEYPWPVTTTASGPSATFATRSFTGRIGTTGIRMHDLVSNGTGQGVRIQVVMSQPGEVVVVRLR